MDDFKKWYFFTLLTVIFSSITYIFLDIAFSNYWEIDAWLWLFYWMLWSIILSAPFFLFSKNNIYKIRSTTKNHWKVLLFIWLTTAIFGLMWAMAIKDWWSWPVWLLSKVDVIFTFLLWVLLLNEKVNYKEIIWLIIAIIWFWFIAFLKWEISLFAVFLIVGWKFIFSFQSFVTKKYAQWLNWFSFAYIRMILSCLFLFPLILFQWKFSPIPIPALIFLIISQVCWSFIWKIYYFEAHNYLDISKLNTALLLTPVVVLILAYFIFWDQVSIQKFTWAVLIILWLFIFISNRFLSKRLEKYRETV